MHPFDHNLETTSTITGNWQQYADSIDNNYLEVCQDKIVLEIAGAASGVISKKIVARNPKKFIMVDPGTTDFYIPPGPNMEFFPEDIHHWLSKPSPADVVVCFGLLYHLHSPLHLLELIVNYCNPTTIILDTVVAPHPLKYNDESLNLPGNRQADSNWKVAPFNVGVPFFVVNQSLDHMGYQLKKTHHLKCDHFSKHNSWVASWNLKLGNQI